MNRGRRRKTLPDFRDSKVEFVKATQVKQSYDPTKWVVTVNVNGWPHDIGMWAKDELDIMKQVFEWQRGNPPQNAFEVSR